MLFFMNCTYVRSTVASGLKDSIAVWAFCGHQHMPWLNMIHHVRFDFCCLVTRSAPPMCRSFCHLNHVTFYLLLNCFHVCKFISIFNFLASGTIKCIKHHNSKFMNVNSIVKSLQYLVKKNYLCFLHWLGQEWHWDHQIRPHNFHMARKLLHTFVQ